LLRSLRSRSKADRYPSLWPDKHGQNRRQIEFIEFVEFVGFVEFGETRGW
jgi:hypothetical protein